MAASSPAKDRFLNYPDAIAGPESPPYTTPQAKNPVLSGLSLSLAATIVTSLPPLQSFLYNNGGFNCLSRIEKLKEYTPRYDPTVIPRPTGPAASNEDLVSAANATYLQQQQQQQQQRPEGSKETGDGSPYTRIADFHSAYTEGKTTPLRVAEVVLRLLEDDERFRGAFLSVRKDDVLAAAREASERFRNGKSRGVLDGVPVAIKDEVDLAGHPTTVGTRMHLTGPGCETSWCVQKWIDAGAIVIGKLNMHEYGFDTNGNNPNHGSTPLNPHSPNKHYPGGSSSASATTVSANLLPLTLGRDGGGSIRIPSNYCGIYGLKPTHDRVSILPTVNVAASTGVTGPLAGSMSDLELGYRIMSAPHPSSAFSPAMPPQLPSSEGSPPTGGKVLGICRDWLDSADPPVKHLCTAALEHYTALGYRTVDITIPHLHEGQIAHALTISVEAACSIPGSRVRAFTPANQILIATFARTPGMDLLLAQKMRALLMSHLASLWAQYPGMVVVSPTTPNAGWAIGAGAGERKTGLLDGNMSVRNMTYIWMANFLGCPALSVPVGRVSGEGTAQGKEGGVPVGLMGMGEWGGEDGLLEWGRVAEQWAWREGQESGEGPRMGKPEIWVDVLEMATAEGKT